MLSAKHDIGAQEVGLTGCMAIKLGVPSTRCAAAQNGFDAAQFVDFSLRCSFINEGRKVR